MSGILDGIRVLDFGRFIAGPQCAALLADLGAEVIRVERVDGGDDRLNQYPLDDSGIAANFLQQNRNKLGMTLNPMKAESADIIRRLLKSADVLVANLPVSTMEQMGIDYESAAAINPDIIVTAATAFGLSGPYRDHVGLDGIGQSMGGAVYLSGSPDQPSKSFASWADVLTGTYAAFGTVAALFHRQATGSGQLVGADLFTTGISALSWIHTEQAAVKKNRVATENRAQSGGPADILKTSDGWIIMQTIGDVLFKRWADLMGEDHWIKDPRFADDFGRAEHSEILSRRSQEWAAGLTTEEAIQKLEAARIPCGPCLSPQQVLDDEHVVATNMFVDVPYPGLNNPAKLFKTPVEFSSTPGTIRRSPPTLGEHTDEIMESLGFTQPEIDSFRANRVI